MCSEFNVIFSSRIFKAGKDKERSLCKILYNITLNCLLETLRNLLYL